MKKRFLLSTAATPGLAPGEGRRHCRLRSPVLCALGGCLTLSLFLLLLSGCGKPAPAWFAAGHQQLESFKSAFLTGAAPRLVELHFQRALGELKKSGDLDLLQKAWLTRMALQVASREKTERGDYPAIESALSVPANRQFYLFLTGDPAVVDGALLPSAYQPFWQTLQKGETVAAFQKLALIKEPLSRLIAAGVAARLTPISEDLLLTAVETASRNGWKRPLLAWLKESQGFYEKTGQTAKAEAVSRRLALITP